MHKLFTFLFCLYAGLACAETPLFSIVPQGSLPTTVSSIETVSVKYTVTNNAPYTLQNLGLNYKPQGQTPFGVTQNTGTVNSPTTCSNPFTLRYRQSCTLDLTVTGSNVEGGGAFGGPEVCFIGDTPSRCSVPSAGNQLNVRLGASYAYVSDTGLQQILKCTLDTSSSPTQGLFTTCIDSGAGSFGELPIGFTFQTFNNQNYVYIALLNSGPYRCLVGSDGQFSGCGPVTNNLGFIEYLDIAFNTYNGQLYVYVSDGTPGHQVSICTPSADGSSFNSCGVSGTGGFSSGAFGIVFQSFEGTHYAYITNSNFPGPANSINQFTIVSGGQLSLFNTTAVNSTIQIAFTNFNGTNYLYGADSQDNLVNQCTLNGTHGSELDVCTAVSPTSPFTFTTPYGVAIGSINGNQYAYVSNTNAGTVSVCTLAQAPTGFSTCVDSGFSGFSVPYWINLQ